jgi:hypothetical protein
MPLFRRRQETAPTIVAAAQGIDVANFAETQALQLSRQAWQVRAYGYYDDVGEIHYPANYVGNALSKIRLVATEEPASTADEPKETSNQAVKDAVQKLQSPLSGQGGLLRAMGINLFVAAECFLLGYVEDGEQWWEAVSINELEVRPGQQVPMRKRNPVDTPVELPKGTLVVRVWRPHPRYTGLADGAMRNVLDECEKLLLLTRADKAAARSRIAGNGLLYIPNEIIPPSQQPTGASGIEVDEGANPIYQNLVDSMITPIRDEQHPSGVVPVTIFGPAEYADKIKYLTFDRPQAVRATQQREESIQRIATAFDLPSEVLTGKADLNHWCQDGSTEILVRGRGWTMHQDLSEGDTVLTLNHKTGLSEWKPVTDIYRAPVLDEPMYLMESRAHSSLSTAAHRWPIVKSGAKVSGSRRRWTTSADGFAQADRVPVAAPLFEEIYAQKYEDDFVRLVVAFSADGTVQAHGNIRIVKFAEHEIIEMRRILSTLFGPDGFREHAHPTNTADGVGFVLRQAEAAAVFGVCGGHKSIPVSFVDDLTLTQRKVLLDSCIEIGDGVLDGEATMLYQVEPTRLEAFAYAAHLLGYRVTAGKRNQQTGFGDRFLSWVRWATSTTSFAPWSCKQTIVKYTGTVWCPVTENATWLARRNGAVYYTGNTAWQVHEETFQAHLQPFVELICDALTSGYLRPALKRAKVADWQKYLVWYDDSALVVRPDKGQTALQLHESLVISQEALRRETGFNDDDAMPEEEYEKKIGILLQDKQLALTGEPTPEPAPEPGVGPAGGDSPTLKDKTSPPPKELTGPAKGITPEKTPAEKAVTAAAPRRRRAQPVGLRLAQLDVELMTQLRTAASEVLVRELDRAGARIRSKAQGNPDTKQLLAEVPNSLVASVLGPTVVASLSLGDHDLLKGAFASFATRAAAIIAAAQLARNRMLQKYLDMRYQEDPELGDPGDIEEVYGERDTGNRRAAIGGFLAGLTAFALGKLYDPAPEAPIPGRGENDGLFIPTQLIRETVDTAGGSGTGGVGTGGTTVDVLADHGVQTLGYTWVYGPAIRTPFVAHEDLDGIEFSSWDDEQLAVSEDDAWIDAEFFHPGDHRGCLCAVAPILAGE